MRPCEGACSRSENVRAVGDQCLFDVGISGPTDSTAYPLAGARAFEPTGWRRRSWTNARRRSQAAVVFREQPPAPSTCRGQIAVSAAMRAPVFVPCRLLRRMAVLTLPTDNWRRSRSAVRTCPARSHWRGSLPVDCLCRAVPPPMCAAMLRSPNRLRGAGGRGGSAGASARGCPAAGADTADPYRRGRGRRAGDAGRFGRSSRPPSRARRSSQLRAAAAVLDARRGLLRKVCPDGSSGSSGPSTSSPTSSRFYAAGTHDANRPSSYFFVGPTGVGKNHLVECLASSSRGCGGGDPVYSRSKARTTPTVRHQRTEWLDRAAHPQRRGRAAGRIP